MIKTKKLQVLIDGQKDFIDGVLRNEDAIKRLPNLKARIRNHDGVTIATHDTHFNKIQVESNWPPAEGIVYENSYEHKFAGLPAHCIKLTEGWEIHPELLEVLNEKNANGQKKFFAIDKYTFGWTGWKDYLKDFEFDEIEIFGFCTDICVVSNALMLRAIFPNMKITVVENCCAGCTPELHEAALKVMKSCQAKVVTWEELEKENENEA